MQAGQPEDDLALAARLWTARAQIGRVAAELRLLGGRCAVGDGVDWQSVAAEAFRERLRHETAVLQRAATGVDLAAEAVARLARTVQGGGSSW
jgi:hypothetical protein